jgi:hypothetical protein
LADLQLAKSRLKNAGMDILHPNKHKKHLNREEN